MGVSRNKKMADSESALAANMVSLTLDSGTAVQAGLECLPNELVLKVLENVGSARDVAALLATSRRFGPVVGEKGWPNFVRARFGSLAMPGEPVGPEWRQLAESLTWQSRCWDRRSLRFAASYPTSFEGGRAGRRGGGGGALPFRTVLDAGFELGSRQELVVWGAGQDIVARYRGVAGSGSGTGSSWNQMNGGDFGFAAGHGDVQAIKIVAGGILAGRANGDLSLYSTAKDNTFGRLRASFSPYHGTSEPPSLHQGEEWQKTIESIDIRGEKAVVTTNNGPILIYDLPHSLHGDEIAYVTPSAHFDILGSLKRHASSSDTLPSILNAKWIDSSSLAVALRGVKSPLMYLTMTESGWITSTHSENIDLSLRYGPENVPVFPHSLQPVVHHPDIPFDTRLLLSSWRNGTIRLDDIRTPSLHNHIYQDNIQPHDSIGTLLTYGTDRFVGGSLDGAKVKIFDFRWTREYYPTDGLPCGGHDPFPKVYQPFLLKDRRIEHIPLPGCCDHVRGVRCKWHKTSRMLYYRPNAIFMFNTSIPSRLRSNLSVTSLVKSSDVSPSFYIGIRGAMIEASLNPSDTQEIAPYFGLQDWPRGADLQTGYKTVDLHTSMMELGDGAAVGNNGSNIRLPRVYDGQADQHVLRAVREVLRKKHRLDSKFQYLEDFPNEEEEEEA